MMLPCQHLAIRDAPGDNHRRRLSQQRSRRARRPFCGANQSELAV